MQARGQDRGAQGAGRGSSGASPRGLAKYAADMFRCAACEVDCSGETSYVQHLAGKSHVKKAGRKGFAGLLPNDQGVIPPFSPSLLRALGRAGAEAALAAQSHVKASPRGARADSVGISAGAERALVAALEGGACGASGACGAAGLQEAAVDLTGEAPAGETAGRACAEPAQRAAEGAGVPPLVPAGGPLRSARETLPVFPHREALLRAIEGHQVVIVEGETGSGKTTQIPQFILEAKAAAQQPCGVVCTQPRRLAASSVAERIAQERGEFLGASVGYAVRLERRASAATRLLLVTVGVLLRRLERDTELQGTTHVLVDEVHERTVETDLLLLLLRDLCKRRADLKVVLMSATFETNLFAEYFGGACPVVKMSGRMHPVRTLYLEDALQMTNHAVDPQADWALGRRRPGSAWRQQGGGAAEAPTPPTEQLEEGTLQERYGAYSEPVRAALQLLDPDVVNYELLVQVVSLLCAQAPPGPGTDAVLVFLAGQREIEEFMRALRACPQFSEEPARSWVLPLHGGLPADQQRLVFQRAPEGTRKVVCSTNVAETSVTVDDIGFVVDTGRMKEMRYDPAKRLASLEDCPVTRANARQRRGRAGRVAPGVAVHLFTRFRHDALLDDFQAPEVQRVPLEQLVLRIVSTLGRRSQGVSAALVCARLIQPPSRDSVAKSVLELVELEALRVEGGCERLTPLGEHLAIMPVDARIGKLILLGAAFGPDATDKALAVAAALSSRWPFCAPLERRDEANAAQRRFAAKSAEPGMESDHLAVLQAYTEWDSCGDKFGFCQQHFLGFRTMQGIALLRQQLLVILSAAGFVQRGLKLHQVQTLGRRSHSDGVRAALGCTSDGRSASAPLMAALLCAALFPRLIWAVQQPAKKGGQKRKQGEPDAADAKAKACFYVRQPGSDGPVEVALHSSSASSKASSFASPYLVYSELLQTSRLFAREVTPVPPLALLLFGGHLAAEDAAAVGLQPGQAMLTVAGWIRFCVSKRSQSLLLAVRTQLGQLLKRKVEQPDVDLRLPGGLLEAVVQLVSEPPVAMEREPNPVVPPRATGSSPTRPEATPVLPALTTVPATPPPEPEPTIYWLYKWCEVNDGQTFGPFDGRAMEEWQQQNMFAAHPADARRCTAEGAPLEEEWQPADQVDFCPRAGLAALWEASDGARRRVS